MMSRGERERTCKKGCGGEREKASRGVSNLIGKIVLKR